MFVVQSDQIAAEERTDRHYRHGLSTIAVPREMRAEAIHVCDICGADGVVLYVNLPDPQAVVQDRFDIRKCANPACGTLWLDPRPVEADIARAYRVYYTHSTGGETYQATPLRPLREAWLRITGYDSARARSELAFLDEVKPGRVLDIGCGNGARLAHLRQLGWDVVGQDVDAEAAAVASDQFGLTVHVGELSAVGLPAASFSAVISNHVLEHVHDPRRLLSEAFRLVAPGGVLVFCMPNARSINHGCFGSSWMGLDPPRHLRIFTPASLRLLALQAGIPEPRVWTDLAHVESFAGGSYGIKHRLKRGPKAWPRIQAAVAGISMATFALARYRFDKECGEECILWARKPSCQDSGGVQGAKAKSVRDASGADTNSPNSVDHSGK